MRPHPSSRRRGAHRALHPGPATDAFQKHTAHGFQPTRAVNWLGAPAGPARSCALRGWEGDNPRGALCCGRRCFLPAAAAADAGATAAEQSAAGPIAATPPSWGSLDACLGKGQRQRNPPPPRFNRPATGSRLAARSTATHTQPQTHEPPDIPTHPPFTRARPTAHRRDAPVVSRSSALSPVFVCLLPCRCLIAVPGRLPAGPATPRPLCLPLCLSLPAVSFPNRAYLFPGAVFLHLPRVSSSWPSRSLVEPSCRIATPHRRMSAKMVAGRASPVT